MNTRHHDMHLLTGAYAANALTAAELAGFEKHLERCASCAEEIRGLRETSARLGVATAIVPPPEMREQVLAAAGRTRQLPPSGSRLPALGATRRRKVLRWAIPRPAIAIGMAAMVAAIAVLAGFLAGTQHQLDQSRAANHAVAAVLAAPDAQIKTSSTTVGGTVTAVISARDREAVLTTEGMPDPAGNMVYQLWVMSAAGARSAGLMGGSPGGASPPVLASGIRPGERLGITIEPAGGSSKPTTTPVAVIAAYA